MRSGVCALLALLAVVAAAPARADSSTSTTTTASTAPATTPAAPASSPLRAAPLAGTCASAGAAAIVEPNKVPFAVGEGPASLGAGAYPAGTPVLSFDSLDASGAACRPAGVVIHALSLFGGAVTADTVQANGGRGTVESLEVDGNPVALGPGESTAVGGWGLLVADDSVGATLSAPLALHLLESRDGLPAGTIVLVAFDAVPAPTVAKATPTTKTKAKTETKTKAKTKARTQPTAASKHARTHKHRHKAKKHLPLKATPPLGLRHYDFPVARGASYTDTYGAGRSDVSDGWHHGDDLFAPLGTPVVAAADGTLSLVGWNQLGGWRLWLEDAKGNQFYYAHLAGYSRWILHHRHVRAGQVIGFLGRTGDAFTTAAHLHFEIHPHQLLKLAYDGAVDPTAYLRGWHVVRPTRKEIPKPARLRAPKGAPRVEAAVVWRQLMAARTPPAAAAPAALHPGPAGDGSSHFAPHPLAPIVHAAAAIPAGRASSAAFWWLLAFGCVAAAGALGALAAHLLRRRAATRAA
jgi:murein DD-endopeptidase MepM/ murein hydrolase activator NlpD